MQRTILEVRGDGRGQQHVDQDLVVQVVGVPAGGDVLAVAGRGRAGHEGDAGRQRQLPAAVRLPHALPVRAGRGARRRRQRRALQERLGVPAAVPRAELLHC